ncbi:MAG: DUF512 domain-containing protein [Lachnospiraceae bacterium]|nr:DUF512 domain-containing protein [Lachnospiraceae bacterium]
MKQVIKEVRPESIGEEMGFEPGDAILSINGQTIEDVLDYYYFLEGTEIRVEVETLDGELVTLEIEKDEDEDLGLVFEEEFMGKYRHCANKCIFCFIDQLPKGMRSTLYFKDDDSRLSFLSGNYITMTNMSEADLDKIIRYHMSPINVSVHATDPELRVKMLKNPRASELMPRLRKLKEGGITMNAQIVLCKGINDGPQLERSITELAAFYPELRSVGVVPVGLTRFREGLEPLEKFTKEDACVVIDQMKPFQDRFLKDMGTRFVHLSDEFYIKAERELPTEEYYDGYVQIENGVGMMRLFLDEAEEALKSLDPGRQRKGHLSLVTGKAASGLIKDVCRRLEEIYPQVQVDVHVIVNHFFGEDITVTGLLTGRDILEQLRGLDLGSALLLPGNLLKADEDILLDDTPLADIGISLQIPVHVVKCSGADFIRDIISCTEEI